MLSDSKVTEIFYKADDFCMFFNETVKNSPSMKQRNFGTAVFLLITTIVPIFLDYGLISRIEFISYMKLSGDYDFALIIRISPHIIILHQTKLAWFWFVLVFAVSKILKFKFMFHSYCFLYLIIHSCRYTISLPSLSVAVITLPLLSYSNSSYQILVDSLELSSESVSMP